MKHHRVLALVLALCLCMGIATVASAAPAATSFPDFDSTQWYASAVQATVENGLLIGDNHGRLRPQDAITRAEFAQVFHNIIGTYLTEEGTYTESFTGNVLIRTGDVTLSNLTVDGDLILGCGVAEDAVTLSNVTVTGRLVVWGGGTDAVFCNDGTKMPEVLVCRVDNAVKVIYDRDSTLAVYDDIQVGITARAKAFPETQVIFYDISDILEEQENLDQTVTDQQISVTIPADFFLEKEDLVAEGTLANHSEKDTYEIYLTVDGEPVTETATLAPGAALSGIRLLNVLALGDYDATVHVTAIRDSAICYLRKMQSA